MLNIITIAKQKNPAGKFIQNGNDDVTVYIEKLHSNCI